MDKRSLLFMTCVSLSFFGIHAWFGMQQDKERQAYLQKMQEKEIAVQAEKEEQMRIRTVSLSDLPIVSLYADKKQSQKVTEAIAFQGQYWTLAWTDSLPAKVYVKEQGALREISLLSPDCKTHEPILYGNSSTPSVTVPSLAQHHPFDLQLVALNGEINVALGEQRGGKFSLPFQTLDRPAVALVKEADQYIPVGIYKPENKSLKPLSEFTHLSAYVQQPQSVSLTSSPTNETFYVLENEYQQLVFSTRGGSLAEINLPLQSAKDSKSLVKEIDIDRLILADSPQNARFPLHPYYLASESGKTLQQEGSLGGYYPLLRRSILKSDGTAQVSVPAAYYALNIVSEDPAFSELNYRVTHFDADRIEFEASTGQHRIRKTYFIPKEQNGPYCFGLDIQIDGDTQGLWLSSGVPDVEIVGGSYSPLLKLQVTRSQVSEVEAIDLPKKTPTQVSQVTPNWISNCNGFLGLILDPLHSTGSGYQVAQIDGSLVPTRLSLIDSRYNLYPAAQYPGYATYLPLKSGVPLHFRIFAGPFDDNLLKKLDDLYEDPTQNYNPDYASAQSMQGWFSFISAPFAKFLAFLIELFYAVTHSWALSIILLTIALRAMMYPLNSWSIQSSVRMQEIGPRVKAIQDRYKKDPRKAQMEVMNLYRESGINPLTGCLPMFLQMPFLFGMFYLLKSTFPLRGAVFIPGWIDDLAAPDVLFSWGQPLWFIGNEFHLLPILMGATMYVQQKLTSKLPKDPSQLNETQKQQKMMGNLMSVLFAAMFYNFPSGLNIYFMLSTLLGVAQQAWMTKKMQASPKKG